MGHLIPFMEQERLEKLKQAKMEASDAVSGCSLRGWG